MALISSNGTGGGIWSATGTWTGGVVPVEGDCATIAAGDTVTIDDAAPATTIIGDDHVGAAYAITVTGTLQYLSTATVDHVFRCKGNLVISAAGSLQIGTAANPIPSTRLFTIELSYSAALADGKYGLLNSGNMVLQGATKTVKTLLTANVSATGTVLTIGDTTNWEVNDRLAIASTTRTWTQAEDRLIQTVDSGTQVTLTAGVTNAHSGTSPTQAEVINLTRNVKVTSYNTSYRGYVYCVLGSTSNVDYVEFYMIGFNATDKYGITIRTTAVNATDFAYCSVWGLAASNYSFYLNYAQNVVINNCVIYNTSKEFYVIGGSNNYITHNVLIKINTYGLYLKSAPSLILENNTVTSCNDRGYNLYGSSTTFISFDNNIAHSNNLYGFYFYGTQKQTISNLTSWRNGWEGMYLYSVINIIFETLILFGNSTANIMLRSSGVLTFINAMLNGESLFTTSSGIYAADISVGIIIFKDSYFGVISGTKKEHTEDIKLGTEGFFNFLLKNTYLSSATKVLNINNAILGSYVQCEDLDQIAYNDKAWYKNGIVVRDGTTFKYGSYSTRFDYLAVNNEWLDYEVTIPVKNGEQIVVSAWLRKNASYTDANRPKITISGQGITPSSAQMSDVTNTWERVTVSGTPTRTGLAKLTISTYLVNAGASAWVDFNKTDILTGVLNTIEGDFWANGHIAEVFMDTGSITAAEFWKTLEADIDLTGSFGNKIKATNKIVGWLRSLL